MLLTPLPPLALQGTINTLTIFNTVTTFEFTSGILSAINASHVVVRTATGRSVTGTLVTGSVVAPDVFVGGKVDMVTQKGNSVTRVKLSDPSIMPVEIRKSYFANLTVLVNPECTSNNCATKSVTYESGTMVYVMGGNLTFCRDDMSAKSYQLTASTSYGDAIYPLARDSLSRGVPIQVRRSCWAVCPAGYHTPARAVSRPITCRPPGRPGQLQLYSCPG